MAFARVLMLAFVASLLADAAVAADPRPPQLQITFLSEPAPIVNTARPSSSTKWW